MAGTPTNPKPRKRKAAQPAGPKLPKRAQPGSPMVRGDGWDWEAVCEEVENRYMLVGADFPIKDLLDEPFTDDDGKEWNMPSADQFYRATLQDPIVKARWTQIKQLRSLALSDDAFKVLRNVDPIIETDKGIVPNTVGVQFSRAQLDHYRWMMTRLNPTEFGDKQQIEHSGTVSTDWAEVLGGEGAPKPRGSAS